MGNRLWKNLIPAREPCLKLNLTQKQLLAESVSPEIKAKLKKQKLVKKLES